MEEVTQEVERAISKFIANAKLEGARLALEAAGQHIQEYGPSDTIGNWEAAGAIRALDPAKIVGEG